MTSWPYWSVLPYWTIEDPGSFVIQLTTSLLGSFDWWVSQIRSTWPNAGDAHSKGNRMSIRFMLESGDI
jgi:hypothetical protein